MRHLTDLEPIEAVAEARRSEDHGYAAERLDRYLRSRILDFLQNRRGDRTVLGDALLTATRWASRELAGFSQRWGFLLELLEDSRLVPAKADQLELLTDRESSILGELVRTVLLAEESNDLRPKDLATKLKTSEQNVNNYLRRLEKQGLLVRHRVPGQRAVVVFPTRQGIDLADRLNLAKPATASVEPDESTLAAKVILWPQVA